MNWYKKAQDKQYLYHGTSEGYFRKIREQGLIPQGNKYIYFSDQQQYASSYSERKGNPYGNRILRVKRRMDMIPDVNTNYSGDFKTNIPIPPEEIDVLINDKWIPIVQYVNEDIGIMPLKKAKNIKWRKKAQGELEDVENLSSLQDIYNFFKTNNISFDLLEFPTGKKIIKVQDYIIDDFESPYLYAIDRWFFEMDDNELYDFYNIPDFNEEFWNEAGQGTVLYHATKQKNVNYILKDGLMMQNQSRSISNRSTPSAIFASDNLNDIESYGDVVLEINISEMKKDGYMPKVEKEQPLSLSEYKYALGNKIGLEYFGEEYASEGIYDSTVVIYGNIPPKYIKRF